MIMLSYHPIHPTYLNSDTVADNNINNYLYNGGTELNPTTGLYMTPFRRYSLSPTEGWRNPATGRFNGIDLPVRNSTVGRVEAGAMASSFSSMTPYQYAFNNPISFNDSSGLEPGNPGMQPLCLSDEAVQSNLTYNNKSLTAKAEADGEVYNTNYDNLGALGSGVPDQWWKEIWDCYDCVQLCSSSSSIKITGCM